MAINVNLAGALAPLLNYRGVAPAPQATQQPQDTGMLGNLLGGVQQAPETQQQAMQRQIGGLFGVDTRTTAQKLRDQLKSMGNITDPAQQRAAIETISKIDAIAGLELSNKFSALNAQNAQTEANLATAELRRKQTELAEGDQAIAQTTAEAQRTNAEANRFRAQNEADTWDREYQLELDKIDAQNSRIATDLQIATLNSEALKSADRARIQAQLDASKEQSDAANSMRRIALAYEARKPLSGIAGRTQDKWERFWGSQGNDAILRAQATQVINGAALNFLPPGAASDADINMVREGFLTAFDDPKAISEFMRGMAKAAALEAEYLQRKAAFMKENQGMSVGFDDEWRQAVKEPGFIDYMEQNYGVHIVTSDEEQAELDKQRGDIDFETIPAPSVPKIPSYKTAID